MSLIEIAAYDKNESLAIKLNSNRYNEAFCPAHFNAFGYPSRISELSQLSHFVDVMQEDRFEFYLNKLGGLTEEEFSLYISLASSISQLAKSKFGLKACGRNALAHSINVLRHIKFLSNNSTQRVFEIGPGCGYVGAMLAASGYSYMSNDVTQAFYLYQNFVWNFLHGDRVQELAIAPASIDRINELLARQGKDSSLIHLPWWEYCKLPFGKIPTVDIITCNHILCEMHSTSLSFFAKLARLMLEQSNGARKIIFEGWGWNASNRVSTIVGEFYKNGFVLAHQDENITVLSLKSDTQNGAYLEFTPEAFTNGGLAFASGKCYLDEYVRNFSSTNSVVYKNIFEARERHKSRLTVNCEMVRAALVPLVGEEGLMTEDEKLMHFINTPVQT